MRAELIVSLVAIEKSRLRRKGSSVASKESLNVYKLLLVNTNEIIRESDAVMYQVKV